MSSKSDFSALGRGGRRSDGNGSEQKVSPVLQLVKTRHRSLRDRLVSGRCSMEPVQSAVHFPSVQPHRQGAGQSEDRGSGQSDPNSSLVVLETVLPAAVQNVVGLPETAVQQDVNSEHGHGRVSTEHETATTGRCTDYWAIRPENGGLSRCAKELIGASWRPGTEGQYSRAWRRWLRYCKSSPGVSPITPSLNQVIEYLTSLYTAGLQYRTINVHRSALSMTLKPVEGFNVGEHPLVRRLLKGVFNVRPPKKKLVPSWSVQKVLDTLAEWSPSAQLDLKTLTYKTAMLVSLATAKRCSSLSLLSVKPGFCEISGSQARFPKNVMPPF